MGQIRASEWIADHQVENQQIEASSSIMRIIPGYSFSISEQPRRAIYRDYTMLSVVHSGHNPQVHEDETNGLPTTYENQFVCIPRDVIYKAPKLPAPIVDGPQTAVVVGPDGEEIYTDALGRIKVQFHWDRYGNNDEHASCWIESANRWQHPHGELYLPRIGHEVVVTEGT